MLTWRNVLIACVLTGYVAWSANQLLHDPPAIPQRPEEWDPQPVIVEVMV
jgi:hypothetical protein